MRSILCLTFLFLVFSNAVLCQAQGSEKKRDCKICREHQTVYSPYELSFKSEISYMAAGIGLSAIGYSFMQNKAKIDFTSQEIDELKRTDINKFDRSASYKWNTKADKASDLFLATSVIYPAFLLLDKHVRNNFGQIIVMGAEVSLINIGLTLTSKYTTHRTRPFVYNDELDKTIRLTPDSRESFFSGHTSLSASYSFFFAQVISDFHPNMKKGWKIGIWSFSAALPLATGYLRYESGNHFPTDIITGYAVGALTGWLIPYLHKKKPSAVDINLYPAHIFGLGGIGLNVSL